MHSYLIRDALLVDGSGAPPLPADVAISGTHIVNVAPRINEPAARVIYAQGLVLAPGFIDIHSHTDSTLFRYPLVESKAFQGVTVEVTGNCGLGVFPVPHQQREFSDYLAMHDFYLPPAGFAWSDFASYAAAVDQEGLGVNVAPLVGHAPLRMAAMGMENRPPTPEELLQMQRLLDQSLSQGAWGMSTGLIYPPGSYAATSELMALARILRAHNALYTSHIRNEGDGIWGALAEAITVGGESGVRVQVSHLKAMGKKQHGRAGEVLDLLAAARLGGVDVGADQYPYHASGTTLSAMVPQWAHEGGVVALLLRLQAPHLREQLVAEIGRDMAAREGAHGIMVSNCRSERNRPLSGKSIAEIARLWGCSAEEAVIRLIVEEEAGVGGIFFSMAERDVTTILAAPMVCIGSDGQGLNAQQAAGEATHPRSYGTFPRVLGRYVREQQVLTLEAAVHKMTGLPASRLGFTDRGLIRPGFAADLVLFDPATICDRADFAAPHQYSTGVIHLLVNGRSVIRDGALTGERPGRVLRKVSASTAAGG